MAPVVEVNWMSFLRKYQSCRHHVLKILAVAALSGLASFSNANECVAQSSPGFASLVSDNVEVREAPGFDNAVTFVFKRAGLPVAILDQRPYWVRVEDTTGTKGWVSADMLSRRRTGIVLPPPQGANEPARALRSSARSTSDVLAYLEAGVVVGVVSCDGRACRITTSGIRGFVDQDHLWGVAAGETIK